MLPRHPSLNSSPGLDAGTVTYYDHEHIAMAIDTAEGLYTPVIRDAGEALHRLHESSCLCRHRCGQQAGGARVLQGK